MGLGIYSCDESITLFSRLPDICDAELAANYKCLLCIQFEQGIQEYFGTFRL